MKFLAVFLAFAINAAIIKAQVIGNVSTEPQGTDRPPKSDADEPSEPDGTKPSTTDVDEPSTPDGDEPPTSDGDEPSTLDGGEPSNSESSTPQDTEPLKPNGTEPSKPDNTNPSKPDDTEPSEPRGTEPSEPGGDEPPTSDGGESSNPDSTESTTPQDTEPLKPNGTEPSKPDDTESSESGGDDPPTSGGNGSPNRNSDESPAPTAKFGDVNRIAQPSIDPENSCAGRGIAGYSTVSDNDSSGSTQMNIPNGRRIDASSPDFTYVINAKRTSQTIAPHYSVVYIYYQIESAQNITYFKTINDENPFIIEVYLTNSDADFIYTVDAEVGLNSCTNTETKTWDSVIVSIIDKGIMPNKKCPVAQGSYIINQYVDPITATFSEMIDCGEYQLYANLYYNDVWAIQLGFSFTVEDDDKCISN